MVVTHFQRNPFSPYFSIERVFSAVRGRFPSWVKCDVAICQYNGTRPLQLAHNIFEAVLRQRGINHITGDTHYLTWFLRKKRTVLTVHDCGNMHRLQGWRRRLWQFCWLWLPVRRCALITVVSEQTKLELMRYTGSPAEKIRIVPDPVGDEFRPSPREFAAIPVILQVGTLPNKNIGVVAAALKDVSCELHIVGRLPPGDRRRLDQTGIRYRVSYSLTDEQMMQAYQDCDVVMLVSTYEGFGMPIIEAQAVGRPVVTSNIEPMTSVSGGAACFVDPHDPESVRSGTLRVLEDSDYRQDLVRRGYENVKRFRAEVVANAYLAIYREISPSPGRAKAQTS